MKPLKDLFHRPLVFIEGKGGVGKTVITHAAAHALAKQKQKTLLVTIEDPHLDPGALVQITPHLWHLNCEAMTAFEEYAGIRIGIPALTRIFLRNKLMQYLAKAAPGVREIVLLGKIWHERKNYTHIVVDMPSTGYGITMFQSTRNFANLFKGGPIQKDALAMLETFDDPNSTAQIIVSLAEEMPLRESLELRDYLLDLFPSNAPGYLVNRRFPKSEIVSERQLKDSPVPQSASEYLAHRYSLEEQNLELWKSEKLAFAELPYIPPVLKNNFDHQVEMISSLLMEKGLL